MSLVIRELQIFEKIALIKTVKKKRMCIGKSVGKSSYAPSGEIWKYTLKCSTHVRSDPAIPVVGMTPEASDGGAVCPESPCSVASHGTRAVKMRFTCEQHKARHAGGAPSL